MATTFSPEEWARIDAILDEVLDSEPSVRGAVLERACGGDPRLRREVESLIAADARASSFLETPAAEYAARLVVAGGGADDLQDGARPGDRIGPYRILKEIGRGGMGCVYLAERADGQFQQQVALKLVGAAHQRGEIVERFLRERQILARLQHPNIARLLDGGVTPDGRPYFAMEYVNGEPITTYSDARALDIDARLDLFASVCDAVQYAHQSLVVHRDLKPSNTLVTPDGRVKLLDFGIAKVLHESDEEADATLTRFGGGPMTPEYAAPEQVLGEPVTTAADVYALGALGYELLTGRSPHRLGKRTAADVARVITERAVERPSAAISRTHLPDATESDRLTIARRRATEPDRLRRRLKGDLDTILMKALQKAPERRYLSAGALAEDIRRFRAGLPIAARPDSVRYRATKFVRRHAIGVAATLLILASLVAGLIGTAWQARVASREAATAREVSLFLAGLFEVSDPALANADKITARELLDRGATRIETELSGQPPVQATMMLLLGRIYRELGVYDRARPLLERSLALRRSMAGGRSDPRVAESASELALLWLDTGHPADAEQLQREALAMRRELHRAGDPALARTLRDLAAILHNRGAYGEAETLQREGLALDEELFGPEHPEVASDLEGLQSILRARGLMEPAEAAARRVLEIRQKVLGLDHLETATAMNNLAIILAEQWKLADAERLYRHVLDFDLRRLGEVHPNTATVMNNLAFVLRDRGEYEQAERLYRSALDLDRRLFGPEHPYVATVLNNLAVLLTAKGQYEEAETHFLESLAMFRRIYGDDHWRVGAVQGALATALSRQRDEQAVALFREALARLERTLPAGHPSFEPVLIGLGRELTRRGLPREGEPLLRRAFETRLARLGPKHPRTAEAQVALGAALASLGRPAEAAPLLTAGHERLREEPHFREQAREAADLLATGNPGVQPDRSAAGRRSARAS